MPSIFLKFKKALSIILILSFLLPAMAMLNPQKAQATIPTIDYSAILTAIKGWASQAAQWAKENARWVEENALKYLEARVLRLLTQAIVNWIDNGFKGNPAFITNTGQFLEDTADATIGDLLMSSTTGLAFLCDPFKIQVKLSLGLQYRPFQDQIKCSLTGVLKNIKGAMNDFTNGDFIAGGGWDSWVQISTVPQNNQMGAMILAQNEMDARITGSKNVALTEASWGNGFLSYKDDKGVIQTPGSVISNKIDWADTSDIRKTELANDINEIINALVNQVVTKMKNGLLKSGDNNRITGSNARQSNINYLNGLQAQSGSGNGVNYSYGTGSGGDNFNSGGDTGSGNGTGDGSGNGTGNGTGSGSGTDVNFNGLTNVTDILTAIDAQNTNENRFLLTQNNIYDLLSTTQDLFNSSTCSPAIKTAIINQLTGNYSPAAKELIWNERDATRAATTTVNNLTSLAQVRGAVAVSTNSTALAGLVQNLNAISTLHSSADIANYSTGGTYLEGVKSWVRGKINLYGTSCGINASLLSSWGI